MTSSAHLLLIEDDPDINNMVSQFMRGHGFRVSTADSGKASERLMAGGKIDLVLLDLMLPDESGLTICSRIRAVSTMPIIIITALGAEADRVVGLEVGADDYITKPFSNRELLARVRAVLRRCRIFDIPDTQATVLMFDGWMLDLRHRRLQSPDKLQMPLSTVEFNILSVFCQHAGRVLSREQLLDMAHGRAATLFDRTIDIQVSRLRRKIEPDPKDPTMIVTVRNGGYMFTPKVRSFVGAQ